MDAALPEGWSEFAVATAGAAAALAGLLIVAISVNIREIIPSRSLTTRGAATIGVLVLALIAACLLLVPGQTHLSLGIELLIATILVCALQGRWIGNALIERPRRPPGETVVKILIALVATVPFVIASILLLIGADGVPWMAAGVIIAFAAAVFNAWILLVEILR